MFLVLKQWSRILRIILEIESYSLLLLRMYSEKHGNYEYLVELGVASTYNLSQASSSSVTNIQSTK